jgi:hypothetical protein
MHKQILMIVITTVVLFAVLKIYLALKSDKEYYRDPIYLNRAKYIYDIYPRTNGSIYGFPHRYGGSWDIFSGHPQYWKAY